MRRPPPPWRGMRCRRRPLPPRGGRCGSGTGRGRRPAGSGSPGIARAGRRTGADWGSFGVTFCGTTLAGSHAIYVPHLCAASMCSIYVQHLVAARSDRVLSGAGGLLLSAAVVPPVLGPGQNLHIRIRLRLGDGSTERPGPGGCAVTRPRCRGGPLAERVYLRAGPGLLLLGWHAPGLIRPVCRGRCKCSAAPASRLGQRGGRRS